MNSHDDLKVRCPFNCEHVVTDRQLKWHMVRRKCEQAWIASNPGKPIFRCAHNWQHIFFSEDDLKAHNQPGVCNRDDHNQTLVAFVPMDNKKKKSSRPNQSKRLSNSSSPQED